MIDFRIVLAAFQSALWLKPAWNAQAISNYGGFHLNNQSIESCFFCLGLQKRLKAHPTDYAIRSPMSMLLAQQAIITACIEQRGTSLAPRKVRNFSKTGNLSELRTAFVNKLIKHMTHTHGSCDNRQVLMSYPLIILPAEALLIAFAFGRLSAVQQLQFPVHLVIRSIKFVFD